MKWLPMVSLALLALTAVPASAQTKSTPTGTAPVVKTGTSPVARPSTTPMISIASEGVSPTPEMWYYEQQMRMYNDPKTMARQKAEFRSAERQRRLETLKWYGFSNSRPRAGSDPVHGDYAPTWVSGNSYHPMQWSGADSGIVILGSRGRSAF